MIIMLIFLISDHLILSFKDGAQISGYTHSKEIKANLFALNTDDYRGTGIGLMLFGYPLDLNLATKEELMLLKGIGIKRAFDILRLRNDIGFFLLKEEICYPYGPVPYRVFQRIKGDIRAYID